MSKVVIGLFAGSGFDRAAQGVAGAGGRLAETLGGELVVALLGPDGSQVEAGLGGIADRIVIADQGELEEYQPEVYLAALEAICKETSPTCVLLGGDTYSQELVPRLAHRLGGSSMADVADLRVADDGSLQALRGAYGGKASAVFALKRNPAVVSLRARSFPPADSRDIATESERVSLELTAPPALRIVERQSAAQDGVRLEDAKVIVSGGRGLGGPEPFEELRRLAEKMDAEMAASRAACDAGWVPPNWQVGQTGKKVAPELYLAVGISGASQHLLGMGDSKVVAAINTDPDAPIFKHCTFGIVEDYRKVVPLLTERLAALNQ